MLREALEALEERGYLEVIEPPRVMVRVALCHPWYG